MNYFRTFVLFLCFIGVGNAQDPDPVLFENDWFLTELVIDGDEINIPFNSDFSSVPLVFENTASLYTFVCNSIGAGTPEFTDTLFTTNGFSLLTFNCSLQSTFDFESIYFGDFYREGILNSTFFYELEEPSSDILWLTITNEDGHSARYGNSKALSVQNVKGMSMALFPNPVQNVLYIQLKNTLTEGRISLYDTQGRLVINPINFSREELIKINLTGIPSGMYFIKKADTDGISDVSWIIKE